MSLTQEQVMQSNQLKKQENNMAKKSNKVKESLEKIRNKIRIDFIVLVADKGFRGELFTFDLCSMYGLELANSTIDKIVVCDEDVLFYYNENTNDYDSIEAFKTEELAEFYDNLVAAIEDDERIMWEENEAEARCARLG